MFKGKDIQSSWGFFLCFSFHHFPFCWTFPLSLFLQVNKPPSLSLPTDILPSPALHVLSRLANMQSHSSLSMDCIYFHSCCRLLPIYVIISTLGSFFEASNITCFALRWGEFLLNCPGSSPSNVWTNWAPSSGVPPAPPPPPSLVLICSADGRLRLSQLSPADRSDIGLRCSSQLRQKWSSAPKIIPSNITEEQKWTRVLLILLNYEN